MYGRKRKIPKLRPMWAGKSRVSAMTPSVGRKREGVCMLATCGQESAVCRESATRHACRTIVCRLHSRSQWSYVVNAKKRTLRNVLSKWSHHRCSWEPGIAIITCITPALELLKETHLCEWISCVPWMCSSTRTGSIFISLARFISGSRALWPWELSQMPRCVAKQMLVSCIGQQKTWFKLNYETAICALLVLSCQSARMHRNGCSFRKKDSDTHGFCIITLYSCLAAHLHLNHHYSRELGKWCKLVFIAISRSVETSLVWATRVA